jgi:hypothetical protein|tara:strand:- start:119 stop:583 length:465 start_codon:yes stop_codon:yes gene_type:complete
MKLEVQRFSSQSNSTLGMLFDITDKPIFLCYTLEDEFREVKVSGETRIPSGTYNITLRTEGGFNERYTEKFGSSFNKGMLWVRDVPNFEYILIHIGNTDQDSSGCLLVGDSQTQNITKNGFIGASTDAYKRIYPKIADVLVSGGKVDITYVDYD